jgi:cholinesterase
VLVWIYGGGYVGGYKTSSGSPASLIARSQENGKEGVVYVALNYRLGAFVRFSPIFRNSDHVLTLCRAGWQGIRTSLQM